MVRGPNVGEVGAAIEVGATGTTMHQIDECVPLGEVNSLTRIYEAILDAYFPA